jgi:hypothetical protein
MSKDSLVYEKSPEKEAVQESDLAKTVISIYAEITGLLDLMKTSKQVLFRVRIEKIGFLDDLRQSLAKKLLFDEQKFLEECQSYFQKLVGKADSANSTDHGKDAVDLHVQLPVSLEKLVRKEINILLNKKFFALIRPRMIYDLGASFSPVRNGSSELMRTDEWLVKQLLLEGSKVKMLDKRCGLAILREIDKKIFHWFREIACTRNLGDYYAPKITAFSSNYDYPINDGEEWTQNKDIHHLGIGLAFLDCHFNYYRKLVRGYLKPEEFPKPFLRVFSSGGIERVASGENNLPRNVDGEYKFVLLLHKELCDMLNEPSSVYEKYGTSLEYQVMNKKLAFEDFSLEVNRDLERGGMVIPLLDWEKYEPSGEKIFDSPRHMVAIVGIDQNKSWLIFDPAKDSLQLVDPKIIYNSLFDGQFISLGYQPSVEPETNQQRTN